MDIKIRVCTESQPRRRKFSHSSCRDSNPWPFNHESGALTTELSPPLHVMCVAFPSKTPDSTKAFKCLQSSVSTQLKEKESELLNQHITITITAITNVQTMIVIHIIYIYFVKFWQCETDTVVWCYLYQGWCYGNIQLYFILRYRTLVLTLSSQIDPPLNTNHHCHLWDILYKS